MANIGGVTVFELHDGLSEGMAWGEGASATKNYFVPNWFDRFTVANALLGLSSYTLVGGHLTINQPGIYPDSSNLMARQVSIRGAGSNLQGPKQIGYTSAIVTVGYSVPQWSPPGSDPGGLQSFDTSTPLVYATQRIKFGGSWITIPRTKLKTVSGKNLDQDFGRFVGVNTLSVTLHQFPFLVNVSMRNLIGKINSSPFFASDTGKLMLHGIDTNRTAAVDGTVNQESVLEFSERPEAPWDYTFTGSGATGWEQVVTQSGSPSIPSGDFTALIPAFYRGL